VAAAAAPAARGVAIVVSARHALAALRRTDWGRLAEWVVLAAVLAIAALISYTHLREVWRIVGAPWAGIGPLTIDGLFAAAWLRMRRRRRQDQDVGRLVLTTLFGALVVTVAGNVAAAFPAWVAGQRDYVAPVVYAWAALAVAFVFELVTGHDRHLVGHASPAGPADVAEAGEDDRAASLIAAGYGRRKLARELQIQPHEARKLLDARRNGGGP
jgi:hypothetical protein